MWETRGRRIRAVYGQGVEQLEQQRYDDAIASLDKAVALVRESGRLAPMLADVLHTRAVALQRAGRWVESEASLRESIDVRRALADPLPAPQVERLADSLELLAEMLTQGRHFADADALRVEVLGLREHAEWSEWARGLLNRSGTLLQSGRTEEGLAVATQLVREALEQPNSSGVADPSFADGLVNLAVLLRSGGHWDEALGVQEVAVETLRPLAGLGDDELAADFATALANHSIMHLECGWLEEAVAPGAEALAIREELAGRVPASFAPALTDSLNNQAAVLHELGRHEEAEPLARRCVELRRQLHAERPRAYERKLPNALATHAEVLVACGRGAAALPPAREGAERMAALEAAEPGAHTIWLASALDTCAAALAASGDAREAFTTSGDAVVSGRTAYERSAGAAGIPFTQVLLACARRHRHDQPDQALAWAEEAVSVLRDLSAHEPEAHALPLARAEALRAELAGA